jgi:hypothetical protein
MWFLFNDTLPFSCSNIPSLSFMLTLPPAFAISKLTFDVQWLQCGLLCVANTTAKQGRPCSLANKCVQHAMGHGDIFIIDAIDVPKQMLFMRSLSGTLRKV